MSSVKGPDGAQEREREFERLVSRYQQTLLRMCYLHLRDRTLAEDAVQETFIKVYRSMDSFRGECSEKTWIMKIAMRTCGDFNRSGWFRFVERGITPDMLPEASVPFEPREEGLVTAVMTLPPRLREVILLYYYQEMNTVEIAEALGISQSSVSGRLKRAREKLREILKGSETNE